MSKKFGSEGELNSYLATRSYIEGYSYSVADKSALEALSGIPDQAQFPHAFRWAVHISVLVGVNNVKFSAPKAPAPAPPAAKPESKPAAKAAAEPAKPAKKDDFDDMFGDEEPAKAAPVQAPKEADDIFADVADMDETDEEKAATLARRKRMEDARKLKEAADAAKGKKKAEKGVEKSLVVLEVKPWEADCDLEAVWKRIIAFEKEGLSWGQTFKLEPVAFGIKKLVMTCTIVDQLVVMDDITDNIEAMDDVVQSVQVASMNKV